MQLSLRRHALPGLELVVVLGVAVLGSYFVSQRYCVASPVVLLGAGFLLGFIPVLRRVSLPPEVVLFLFLPAAIAPTDATAVGVLAKALPCRSVTILSAESLANDGTALVIYALAVGITAGEEHPSVLRRSTRCGSHRQRAAPLPFPASRAGRHPAQSIVIRTDGMGKCSMGALRRSAWPDYVQHDQQLCFLV
jgi:hypothetical protein